MAGQSINPFLLAANVPQPDERLLPFLRANPQKASEQDSHGYSLLHAAASYNHADLLRALVREFGVDVNLKDEDGETCLFVSESVEIAQCLVEELNIDAAIRNEEGQTAADKILAEDEYPEIAVYLQQRLDAAPGQPTNTSSSASGAAHNHAHPPPLPPNVNIKFDAVSEEQLGVTGSQQPDPEFRRRIEELAARENFNTEEGQRELRELITDAVRGAQSEDREVRRRVD